MTKEMARLQEKLEGYGVVEPVMEAQSNEACARYLREEDDEPAEKSTASRESIMMKGTVDGPQWKDPSDPVNW